jgi:hypothetical protein
MASTARQCSFPNHKVVEIELLAPCLDDTCIYNGFKPELSKELIGVCAVANQAEGLEVGGVVASAAFPGHDMMHLGEPARDIGQRFVALLTMKSISGEDASSDLLPARRLQCRRHILMGQVIPTALIAPFTSIFECLLDLMRDHASFIIEECGMSFAASDASSNEGRLASRNVKANLMVPCPVFAILFCPCVAGP